MPSSSRSARLAQIVGAIACALVLVTAGAAVVTAGDGAQRGAAAGAVVEPPLAMTCPMHPEIVEEKPGSCPLCKMTLVPARLESAWTCPLHQVIAEKEPGACRLCGRQLVQVTMTFSWSCLARPDINEVNRGTCPDGSAMIPKRTLRAHGNHNPQHGGQFFMAPDNWHHLEGTYPRDRVFRLYLYDDYSRPLAIAKVRDVRGRVVTKERFDPATRATTEQAAFTLRPANGGRYLEATVDGAALPAQMTAKVRLKADGPEYRFDFTFPALTRDPEPAAPPAPRTTRNTVTPAAPRAAAAASPAPAAPAASALPAAADPQPDPSLIAVPIPESVPEIVAQLQRRSDEVRAVIERGNFGAVFVPAFQARDLAIALESRLDDIEPARRGVAEPAIRALVRTAWLLDAVGDVGNRQQLGDAYAAFAAQVAAVTSAFGGGGQP